MRKTRLFVVALVLPGGLLACGGDDDGAGTPTTEASSAPPDPSGGDTVAIAGFAFDPEELEVPAGTTVSWTNGDDTEHSVESTSDLPFESQDLGQGQTFTSDFDQAGEYGYVCGIHDFMTGSVTVRD